jgi:phosphotransferase system enzyme I (PtsI)
MRRLVGTGASPGIAIGIAHFLGGRVEVYERHIAPDEVESEQRRFAEALARSNAELERIQQQISAQEGDGHQYQILQAHRLMLTDVHLVEETRRIIREQKVSAEWALRRALDQIQAVFSRIENPYFRDRRSDVDNVGEQILRNLVGVEASPNEAVPRGAVVFAHDLSPADVIELGRAGVSGFFTEGGGKTSHTAVVARALGLPHVVGVQDFVQHIHPGTIVIVDGGRGEVILDPDETARSLYRGRAARDLERAHRLAAVGEAPGVTRDGTRIHLAANVELLEEVPSAVELGAESIGLFRTEFLYLERSELPTEEEQHAHLVAALKMLGGKVATFRTLDLGGDKLPASVRMPAGSNPALGLRSIRFSLSQRDVFKAQLRAIYRAATVAPLRILFPMISGVAELRAAKEVCAEACAALKREGVPHDPAVPLGVMIETPSAAFIADMLAEECEFLTIGTNDLIQYSLAADRQDEHVGYLYHPLHPSVLRTIRQIVLLAERAGKPIAMCGDMAGDPLFTWVLLGLGLRDFSMAPRQISQVKSIIRGTRLEDAEGLVQRIMNLRTEGEVEDVVMGVMRERFPLEFIDSEDEGPSGG